MSAAGRVEEGAVLVPPAIPQQTRRTITGYTGATLECWAPGQSGNPTGRSKRFHEVQRAAQDKSIQAIEKLGLLMSCGDERVELMAASAILDRAFGKPKEQKADDAALARPNLAALGPDDLAALRRIMAALVATPPDAVG